MPTSFSHIDLCLVTLPLPLLQLLRNCYCYFCHCYWYFHTTFLLNTLLQILSYPGVVELTTQMLILENILWLPLCWINKFGLNTLPSKTVVIPYTCGLSKLFSGAIAGEHSSILWVTWDLYLLITMRNLKDERTKIFPSTTRGGKELPSSFALHSPSVMSKLATPKRASAINSQPPSPPVTVFARFSIFVFSADNPHV